MRSDRTEKLSGYAGTLREHVSGRSLAYVGAGLALAGTGAAAAAGGFAGPAAGPVRQADSINRATAPVSASQHPGRPEAASHQVKHVLSQHTEATKPTVHVTGKPQQADTKAKASHGTESRGSESRRSEHMASQHHATKATNAAHHGTAAHVSTHQQSAHRMTFRWTRGGGHPKAWDAIERFAAGQSVSHASHAPLPAGDRLTPVGTTGPQSWMQMTPARYDNATTIVRQAVAKKMGLRSAVIAVATAMQESTLLNINYGDSDSVGLFQQRPSCGWGTAAQIQHPSYAADAFLNALRSYQDGDPSWSQQPLWQTAQGVQASGFPTAYAKWEAQAAGLVHSIARHLV
ncbi:MAG TPA: hypothetical protein VGM14_00835 [Streptosporangiaceae bacterium]